MEEEFSHEQCREFTYELIQWAVARTMIGYTRPLSDRLSHWAIWYLPRHCSHCGACGDDAHITESGVCDSCLLLEGKDPSTTPAA
jgi:hypothetical protein